MKIIISTTVGANWQLVRSHFKRELLEQLSPPGIKFDLERFDGSSPGDEVHAQTTFLGLKQKWVSIITEEKETNSQWYFVDEGKQLPWPLTGWKHRHSVESLDDKASRIVDDIDFHCASKLTEVAVRPFIWLAFSVRPGRYKKFFEGLK